MHVDEVSPLMGVCVSMAGCLTNLNWSLTYSGSHCSTYWAHCLPVFESSTWQTCLSFILGSRSCLSPGADPPSGFELALERGLQAYVKSKSVDAVSSGFYWSFTSVCLQSFRHLEPGLYWNFVHYCSLDLPSRKHQWSVRYPWSSCCNLSRSRLYC